MVRRISCHCRDEWDQGNKAIMPAINKTYHITGKHKGVGSTPPCGQARGVSKNKTQITHLLSQKDITNNVWSGVFLVTAEMNGIKAKQAINPAINEAHHVAGKHKGVGSIPPSGQATGFSKIKTQIIQSFFLRRISSIWSGVILVTAEMDGIKAKQAIKPAINKTHHIAGKHKGVGSRKISPIVYGQAYSLSLLR